MEARLYFGQSRAQPWGETFLRVSGFCASAGFPTELAAEGSAELAAAGFDLRELARRRCARVATSRLWISAVEAVCGSALWVGVGAHGRVLTQPERGADEGHAHSAE